jgi:ankyrin repeat protein
LQAVLDASDFKDEHMKIVHYLVEKGADVKAKNKSWRFPLLFAADHGRTEAAKLLIEKGADVNDKDQNGGFPLLAAACKGDPDLVALLADRGASMSMASPEGQTPLMCAARQGNLAAITFLLAKGVPINARTAKGSTALIDAAGAGKQDAVKLLLEQGADPGEGSIPDSFIAFNGRTVVVKGKKNKIDDILKNIAKAASQDGYAMTPGPTTKQTTTASVKGPWNRVLNDMAKKNHLFLVVKDKQVFVFPYDPAAIKHAGN